MAAWSVGPALALGLLLLAAVPAAGAGSAPPARPVADAAGTLNATAVFLGWNWTGPGTPCGGGSGTLIAHFAATVLGGTPPYDYNWSFGDGTNNSTVADPSHVYPNDGARTWQATLTVRDSAGATSTNATEVRPAIFTCPSQSAHPTLSTYLPGGLPELLALLAVLGVVFALGVGVGVVLGRRRGPS